MPAGNPGIQIPILSGAPSVQPFMLSAHGDADRASTASVVEGTAEYRANVYDRANVYIGG